MILTGGKGWRGRRGGGGRLPSSPEVMDHSSLNILQMLFCAVVKIYLPENLWFDSCRGGLKGVLKLQEKGGLVRAWRCGGGVLEERGDQSGTHWDREEKLPSSHELETCQHIASRDNPLARYWSACLEILHHFKLQSIKLQTIDQPKSVTRQTSHPNTHIFGNMSLNSLPLQCRIWNS